MRKEKITDEQLTKIVSQSVSWGNVIKLCGARLSGGSYQHYQSRVKNLKLDISHFLGQRAHSGSRHTGIAKKKHWSQILINRKTKDREDSKKFRRAYKEYCEENNISIECVDCKNKGIWFNKPMILEINHKDDCRWNNIPKNLEWVCPNCHSIKTTY